MKVAIYCRVSTSGQEKDGTSLESQAEACLKKAQKLGYSVPDEYLFREVRSGADLDRPELDKLRGIVKLKAVQGVICYATDRLARKAVHIAILAEEWEKRGVSLTFVTEPLDNSPEGQLIRYVKGFAAEIEREKIRERSLRGKRMKAMHGKIPSGSHARLYGHDYDKTKKVRVINEEQAFWVREIFRWCAEGLSVRAIVRKLRALGMPTPNGAPFWIRSTTHKILTNPAYMGKTYAFTQTYVEPKYRMKSDTKRKKTAVVWKPKEEWIEIPNVTPPIVSQELFETVQRQLQRNRELSPGHAKYQYLLRGCIYCLECGRRYSGRTYVWRRNGRRYERRCYSCIGRWKMEIPPCGNRIVKADEVERVVWEEVEKILSKPDLVLQELLRRQEESKRCEYWENELKQAQAKLNALRKREQRLVRAITYGLEDEVVKAEKAAIDSERETLLAEKVYLENQLKLSQECQVDVEGVKRFCKTVNQNLASFGYEDKRLALEALQLKVVVGKDGLSIRGMVPAIVSTASK